MIYQFKEDNVIGEMKLMRKNKKTLLVILMLSIFGITAISQVQQVSASSKWVSVVGDFQIKQAYRLLSYSVVDCRFSAYRKDLGGGEYVFQSPSCVHSVDPCNGWTFTEEDDDTVFYYMGGGYYLCLTYWVEGYIQKNSDTERIDFRVTFCLGADGTYSITYLIQDFVDVNAAKVTGYASYDGTWYLNPSATVVYEDDSATWNANPNLWY